MIVVKRKPIKEILEYIKEFENILVLGCGTCAAVCLEGGEKEARELKGLLNLYSKESDKKISVWEDSAIRLCDPEFVKEIKIKAEKPDAIISLGCGAGVQLVGDIFEDIPVFPGINTTLLGTNDELGVFNEKCLGCGDCILDKTGGICPVARCSKSLLNGPCGGVSSEGKCEVDDEIDCGWYLIYNKLKSIGMLHKLEEPISPKDWRSSASGGVRRMLKDEAVLDEDEENYE